MSPESEIQEWDSRDEFIQDGEDFTNKKASKHFIKNPTILKNTKYNAIAHS